MKKFSGVLPLAFVLLLSALPALAHHSFVAEFDGNRLVTYTGVLTKLEWTNPHGWFYMDVKDQNGTVQSWAFEMDSPNLLRREDAKTRDYFLANMGKVMSVNGCPAKNGTNRAASIHVKFTGGLILPMGPTGRYSGNLNSEQILRDLK